jgi:hypothetical protein
VLQANPHSSATAFWILRLTLVAVVTLAGGVALLLCARGRSAIRWYLGVALLLVAILAIHGLRWSLTILSLLLALVLYVGATLVAERGIAHGERSQE